MTPRLSLEDVVHLFEAGLLGLGGALYRNEAHDDRLYLRGLLDARVDLGGGVVARPGIGLRADGPVAEVVPYVHRAEIGGGLLMVEPIGGALEVDLRDAPATVAGALAEAMAYVAAPGPRRACAEQVRSSHELPGGVALDLLDLSDTVVRDLLLEAADEQATPRPRVLDTVVDPNGRGRTVRERLRAFRVSTGFGLLGAAVDAAREAPDPELRWRLELLAGEVASVSAAARLMGLHDARRPAGRERGEEPVPA